MNLSDLTPIKQFVPLVLQLPTGIDLSAVKLWFEYSASDRNTDVIAPGVSATGRHELSGSGALRLWLKDGSVARNFRDVSQGGDFVSAGSGYTTSSGLYTPAELGIGGDGKLTLWIEAVKPGAGIGSERIVVHLESADGKSASDAVRVAPLKADLGFNNASNHPGDLRPTTPDAEYAIDAADERYEEQGDGLKWWWNRPAGDGKAFADSDLVDLIPFSINIPDWAFTNFPDGRAGYFKLKLEMTGTDDAKLYVYPNISPAGQRLAYLSDPNVDMVASSSAHPMANHLMTRAAPELNLLQPGWAEPVVGSNEYLLRVVGSGTKRFRLTLLWVNYGETTKVPIDSVIMTMRDAEEFYSFASARGNEAAPITEPRILTTYPSEGGRTEIIKKFPVAMIRDRHEPATKQTAVFVHGYNVTYTQAEDTFREVFKRSWWQGFRGNFVGFAWYGNPGVTKFTEATNLATQNSLSFSTFLRHHIRIGWGVTANDIDVIAHSLGNFIVWDALRSNSRIPNRPPLFHNLTSVQAAVWKEAFDAEAPVTYTLNNPITYTTDELKRMSWHHWFNPGDVNIKASITGKITNSYFTEDEPLQYWMRLNEVSKQGDHYDRDVAAPYRSSSNLKSKLALLLPWARTPLYTIDNMSIAIGTVPNPIADRNVDSRNYGWDNSDGMSILGGDIAHSDAFDESYTKMFGWWRYVIAGNGDATWASISIGRDS